MAIKGEEAWLYRDSITEISEWHGRIFVSKTANAHHGNAYFVADGDPMYMGFIVDRQEGKVRDDLVWFYNEASYDVIRSKLMRAQVANLKLAQAMMKNAKRSLLRMGYDFDDICERFVTEND